MIELSPYEGSIAPLELLEPKLEKITLWGTRGKPAYEEIRECAFDVSITGFVSKAEAEAWAARPNLHWEWDRQEAAPRLLSELMLECRECGYLSVKAKAFRDGQWVTIKEYKACEPLPDHER